MSVGIKERIQYPTLPFINVRKKEICDNRKVFGALLTDVSKAFHYLSHDLLIGNLNVYRFRIPALRLVQNYLIKSQTKDQNKL